MVESRAARLAAIWRFARMLTRSRCRTTSVSQTREPRRVQATEADVCIGDVWAWGDALVQVTSPRGPCFKLGIRLGRQALLAGVGGEQHLLAQRVAREAGVLPPLVGLAQLGFHLDLHVRGQWRGGNLAAQQLVLGLSLDDLEPPGVHDIVRPVVDVVP